MSGPPQSPQMPSSQLSRGPAQYPSPEILENGVTVDGSRVSGDSALTHASACVWGILA